MKVWENIGIKEVSYGFGWGHLVDNSTDTINNLLDDLDERFLKQQKRILLMEKLLLKSRAKSNFPTKEWKRLYSELQGE